MPQTTRGIVFPDSTGHTRLWEHYQTLAETADTAIGGTLTLTQVLAVTGRHAAGTGTVGAPSAANGTVTIAVTFPVGRFTAAPVVVAVPTNNLPINSNQVVAVWPTGVSTGGFTCNLRRTTLNATQFSWHAVQA